MEKPAEEMVPRAQVAREWNISHRTVTRWEQARTPGFDDPVEVNGRWYHRRSRLELAKAGRLLQ
jgi:hypothetical protein